MSFLGNGQVIKTTSYHWENFPADRSIEQFEKFKAIYETDTSIRPDLYQRVAFFEKGFKAAAALSIKSDIIFYAQRLSNNYLDIDSFSRAIYYAKQMIATKYDTISVARGYNTLGYIYLNIGDYTNALKAFFNAVNYGKLLNNGWESYPFGNIVSVYKNLEDYDNAIKYTRKSLHLDAKTKSPQREYGFVYNYSYLLKFYQKKRTTRFLSILYQYHQSVYYSNRYLRRRLL